MDENSIAARQFLPSTLLCPAAPAKNHQGSVPFSSAESATPLATRQPNRIGLSPKALAPNNY